jgi:hypothetical protein
MSTAMRQIIPPAAGKHPESRKIHVGDRNYHVGDKTYHVGDRNYHVGNKSYHVGDRKYHVGNKTCHVGDRKYHVGDKSYHVGDIFGKTGKINKVQNNNFLKFSTMKQIVHIMVFMAGAIVGLVVSLFHAEIGSVILTGGGLTIAVGIVGLSGIDAGLLANVRRWHGSIDAQFAAIDNLVNLITGHQPAWTIPADLLSELVSDRDQLQVLINRCRSVEATKLNRAQRNALLKSTVGVCLFQVKIWAYGAYAEGTLTAEEVHALGFLLPGENGGRHQRAEATDIVAEVKVKVINEDFIRVVVDQSAGENAGPVLHGWPPGVNHALIVITAADGTTEVYRQQTTRLHNDIRMPDGSHGKQFIIKAAFLKHVNDEPRFGNEPTFSMPLTTEDLAATLDHQHHEEYEAHLREVERHRQELERLQATIAAAKNDV